jgi:hypothetical protein
MKEAMQRVLAKANDDPEFKIAARMWNADLELVAGDDVVRTAIRNGRVTASSGAANGVPSIRVVGPADGWARMLQPHPPPFYQDLFGATIYHGFKIDGAVEHFGPYYAALRRLLEIAREGGAA